MYIVTLRNLLTGAEFEKQIGSPYLLDKFLRKCKHSENVRVLGVRTSWE